MECLAGKSVLFFCPKFFGYEKEILSKLQDFGAQVDAYDERPENNFITKASIRVNKNLVKSRIEKYYNSILNENAGKKYDYVFVVNIEAMLPGILKRMKAQYGTAQFILYMWDSLQNKKQTVDILPYFDRVFSFDKSDVSKIKGVRFRPLFYIDHYAESANNKIKQVNDLCFIGTVHSDRYHLIREIKDQIHNMSLKGYFFLFFPNPILFLYKKVRDVKFLRARYKEFSFASLPQRDIVKTIQESRVVLDIQHPGQTGLTMRTIEMLGAQKKIITTNPEIKAYDFYNPDNILVIDRDKPVLYESFFTSPYVPLDETISYKYSIGGWLQELFIDTE